MGTPLCFPRIRHTMPASFRSRFRPKKLLLLKASQHIRKDDGPHDYNGGGHDGAKDPQTFAFEYLGHHLRSSNL